MFLKFHYILTNIQFHVSIKKFFIFSEFIENFMHKQQHFSKGVILNRKQASILITQKIYAFIHILEEFTTFISIYNLLSYPRPLLTLYDC